MPIRCRAIHGAAYASILPTFNLALSTREKAGIDRHASAAEEASDHAPAWIVLET